MCSCGHNDKNDLDVWNRCNTSLSNDTKETGRVVLYRLICFSQIAADWLTFAMMLKMMYVYKCFSKVIFIDPMMLWTDNVIHSGLNILCYCTICLVFCFFLQILIILTFCSAKAVSIYLHQSLLTAQIPLLSSSRIFRSYLQNICIFMNYHWPVDWPPGSLQVNGKRIMKIWVYCILSEALGVLALTVGFVQQF